MSWKQSLDKYLTSGPPDDGFDEWCEVVTQSYPDEFFNKNEDWLNASSGQCNKWLNKLFDKGLLPSEAEEIIQRAFLIYIKNKNK